MHRRKLLLFVLLLTGCGGDKLQNPQELLPESSGSWKRSQVASPASVPAAAETLSPVSSAEAVYTDKGRIRVRVLQFKNETVAFELQQKWRQADGVATYKGPYFFIGQAVEGATSQDVMQLVSSIRQSAAVK
jgi:hypothetical protein